MSKKKVERKSTVKPFVKYVNYNHMLPTRFIIKDDLDFKTIVNDDKMADPNARKAMKKELKSLMEAR